MKDHQLLYKIKLGRNSFINRISINFQYFIVMLQRDSLYNHLNILHILAQVNLKEVILIL